MSQNTVKHKPAHAIYWYLLSLLMPDTAAVVPGKMLHTPYMRYFDVNE